jgi:hypothetical protein
MKKKGTTNLRKPVFTSKVVNPFTRALAPPFIVRQRDFYIPRLPSNLKNIPSVNTYMNVFYIPWFAGLISYIHKPGTSSHFEPGLLRWRLWLGSSLTFEALFMKIIAHRDSRTETPPYSRTSRVPDLLSFARFQSSWNRQQICEPNPIRLLSSHNIRNFRESYEIHQGVFMIVSLSWNRTFHPEANSWVYSRIRQIRRFEGERFFPNSPTLAPRGSGLTPTIRFHEKNPEFR